MTLRFQELQQKALGHAFVTASQRASALPMVHLDGGWSLALSVNK